MSLGLSTDGQSFGGVLPVKIQRLERETVIRWIADEPTYRVDFWHPISPESPATSLATGYKQDSCHVSDADIDEVVDWAHREANGRTIAIYVAYARGDEPGLIMLFGADPTVDG
jgi:hypothetical protein